MRVNGSTFAAASSHDLTAGPAETRPINPRESHWNVGTVEGWGKGAQLESSSGGRKTDATRRDAVMNDLYRRKQRTC